MPRTFETRNTALSQLAPAQTGRTVGLQVAARATDSVPNYIPDMKDPDLDGLIQGLSKFQPSLASWQAEEDKKNATTGAADRMAGTAQAQSNKAYKEAYFGTDGLVRGQENGTALLTKYNTEFDKDKGDLEGWLKENYQNPLKGIQDESYIGGFQKGMTPAFQAIREAHLGYQKKAVEVRVESNFNSLMTNGVSAYTDQGQPIPVNYLAALQEHGATLGVSQQRFGELLFATVKQKGDEGHFDAYDVLKADRPDGSKGMYFDPAWKTQIDTAQAHSFTTATVVAQKSRELRYEKALYEPFLEEDPKKAMAMFKALKDSDLFKGDTSNLIKWEKLMVEKVDGKPSIQQVENESAMLGKVLEGKMGIKDILSENSSFAITAGQRKYLLGQAHAVVVENRTLAAANRSAAAAEGKADEAIYKTREYADAKDFVGTMLQPRPRDPNARFDSNTEKTIEFERANAAQAQREFFTGLKGKTAAEVQAHAEDIVKRYKPRQKEFTDSQKENVATNKVPFKTLAEVRAQSHTLSVDELRRYNAYFKGN